MSRIAYAQSGLSAPRRIVVSLTRFNQAQENTGRSSIGGMSRLGFVGLNGLAWSARTFKSSF
jgi:hypothetical protein